MVPRRENPRSYTELDRFRCWPLKASIGKMETISYQPLLIVSSFSFQRRLTQRRPLWSNPLRGLLGEPRREPVKDRGSPKVRARKSSCYRTAGVDRPEAAGWERYLHLIRQNLKAKSTYCVGSQDQLPAQECALGNCLPREAVGPKAGWVQSSITPSCLESLWQRP